MGLAIVITLFGLFIQDLNLTMKEGTDTTFVQNVTGLIDFKIFKQFAFWALIILFFFLQLGKAFTRVFFPNRFVALLGFISGT